MSVRLRNLSEGDFTLIEHWYRAPHMVPFFIDPGGALSLEEVRDKFGPRLLLDSEVKVFIAEWAGQPFGFVQGYAAGHYAEMADILRCHSSVMIDYFIGEARYLGHGLGPQMLRDFQQHVMPRAFATFSTITLYHDTANTRAIRCSHAAGFVDTQTFVFHDKPKLAMEWRKEPSA